MTNGEKYRTAQERTEAFIDYCDHCWEPQCTVREMVYCFADWLELEAEFEKPLNCFYCGSECSCEDGYLECLNDKCCYSCGVRGQSDEITISSHNRVAKAVKEIEVTK